MCDNRAFWSVLIPLSLAHPIGNEVDAPRRCALVPQRHGLRHRECALSMVLVYEQSGCTIRGSFRGYMRSSTCGVMANYWVFIGSFP